MTTPTATPKLPDLARRIAQQEAALAALRRKLDARLTDLNRRRERLRTELRTVETEIEAVSQGESQSGRSVMAQAAPVQAAPKKSEAAPHAQRPARSFPSLAKFLVQLVREGKGEPLAMATLKEQTVRRGFPSGSADIRRIVEKRASELVGRGLLRRDPGTGGYVLPQGKNGSTPGAPPAAGPKSSGAAKATVASKPRVEKAAPQAKATSAAAASARAGQPSLRSVLLDILKKEGRTLSAQELADRAKKAGYKSQSRAFKNVIWVALGNMPEAERDPKGGYRLKKGKR